MADRCVSSMAHPVNDSPRQIGKAFVVPDKEWGWMQGDGDYCGFPITLRIERDNQDGKAGWRVRILVREKDAPG